MNLALNVFDVDHVARLRSGLSTVRCKKYGPFLLPISRQKSDLWVDFWQKKKVLARKSQYFWHLTV